MTAQTTGTGAAPTTRRIAALDALRGFALCGIIFINIPQTMNMMADLSRAPEGVRLFVLGRFYPIFYLLFGLGFGLFLRSASRRTTRPRVPMTRRLLALGVLGALHHLLQPGEVLLPFAVTGLVVLLPLSYAPARVNLAVGAVLTVVGVLLGVGGFGVLPGLFVVGFALAQAGFAERAAGVWTDEHEDPCATKEPRDLRAQEGRRRGKARERRAERGHVAGLPRLGAQLGVAAAGCAAVAVLAYVLVVSGTGGELVGRWFGLVFSMSMAGLYAAGFLLLLRTAAGPALSAVFAPLGRLALTNYLTATVLFVTFGAMLGLRGSDRWATAALLGAAILAVQAIWSPLWLRRFGYGPLEWLWRMVTYWRRVPIRREADPR